MGQQLSVTQTNVISVIAMSMCGEKETSSCDGETCGNETTGTGADVAAPGVKIYCKIFLDPWLQQGGYTGTFNGTSQAPNAAGVALILSASSGLTKLS